MDYNDAKKKALEYGRKRGDRYDISGETKDAYYFGLKDGAVDNQDHGVFVSKETGRMSSISTYEKNHNGNIKMVGKPKTITAEKKVKRK